MGLWEIEYAGSLNIPVATCLLCLVPISSTILGMISLLYPTERAVFNTSILDDTMLQLLLMLP
jgi:hypothetical protein